MSSRSVGPWLSTTAVIIGFLRQKGSGVVALLTRGDDAFPTHWINWRLLVLKELTLPPWISDCLVIGSCCCCCYFSVQYYIALFDLCF